MNFRSSVDESARIWDRLLGFLVSTFLEFLGPSFISFWTGFSAGIFIHYLKIIEEKFQLISWSPSLLKIGIKLH